MGKGGSFQKLSGGGIESATSPDGRDLFVSYYGDDDEGMRTLRRGIIKFNAHAKHVSAAAKSQRTTRNGW
jgi:hypothetical protein